MHVVGVVRPYYINNGVRHVSYYQMLDSYGRSQAQQFPQNSLFQQDELILKLHSPRPSVLYGVKCFQFHDWEIWSNRLASKIAQLRILHSSIWGLGKDQTDWTFAPNLRNLKERISTKVLNCQ